MAIPAEIAAATKTPGGTRLFGVTVEEGLARDGFAYELPAVVDRVLEYLDAEGLQEEGVFRLSGSQATINRLKGIYDEGGDPDLFETNDTHVVAGLLKLYLRELADPLLTYHLFHAWIAAGTAPDLEVRKDLYRCLYAALPKPHRDLLRHLMAFLFRVQQFSEVNKMGIPNLATVIGPNILRLKDQSMMAIVQYTAHINQITGDLIQIANETFAEPPARGPFDYIAVAQAQYPYQAQYEGELTFPAEAFLFVIHKDDDGWWEGNYNGVIGIFPHNYVKVFLVLKEGNGVPSIPVEGDLDASSPDLGASGSLNPQDDAVVQEEVEKVLEETLAGTSAPVELELLAAAAKQEEEQEQARLRQEQQERERKRQQEQQQQQQREQQERERAAAAAAQAQADRAAEAERQEQQKKRQQQQAAAAAGLAATAAVGGGAAVAATSSSSSSSSTTATTTSSTASAGTTPTARDSRASTTDGNLVVPSQNTAGGNNRSARATIGGLGRKAVMAEVERLRTMVDEERARYVKLSAGYETLAETARGLEGRVTDVSAYVQRLESSRAALDAKLAKKESENKVLKSKIIDSESTSLAEHAELAAELSNVRAERNRMSENAALAEAEVRALKANAEEFKIRIASHEANEVAMRGEETRLNSLLGKAISELKSTRDINARLKAKVAELEESSQNSAANIKASLASGVAAAQSELIDTRLELQRARAKLAEADTIQLQFNHVVKENESLKKELEELREQWRMFNASGGNGGGAGGAGGAGGDAASSAAVDAAKAEAERAKADTRRIAKIAQDLTARLKRSEMELAQARQANASASSSPAPFHNPSSAAPTSSAPPPAVPTHRAHIAPTTTSTSSSTPMSLEDELNALEAELASGMAAPSGGSSRRPGQGPAMTPVAQAELDSIIALVSELTVCIGPMADTSRTLEPGSFKESLQSVGSLVKSIKRGLDSTTNQAYDLEGHAVALVKYAVTLLPGLPSSAPPNSSPRATLKERTMSLAHTVKAAVEFWKQRRQRQS